jgi:hypothetical protein
MHAGRDALQKPAPERATHLIDMTAPQLKVNRFLPTQNFRANVGENEDERLNPGDDSASTGKVEKVRNLIYIVHLANVLLGVFGSIALASYGFEAEPKITTTVYRHTTSVLVQSNSTDAMKHPMAHTNFFTDILMGTNGLPIEMLHDSTQPAADFKGYPHIWQYMQSDSQFALTVVHSQYLFLTSLLISASFALCAARKNAYESVMTYQSFRVPLICAWNIVSLVILTILFVDPKAWLQIPLSNFFAAVVFVLVSWVYQIAYLMEISQEDGKGDYENEFTWLRRLLYMEFATTAPFYVVACLVPGSEGVDQWRVQTTLFCVYTFFSIIGLLERWKHVGHQRAMFYSKNMGPSDKSADAALEEELYNDSHSSVMWYLLYGSAAVFLAVINAIGRELVLAKYTHFLGFTVMARVGIVLIFIVMAGVLAISILAYYWETYKVKGDHRELMKGYISTLRAWTSEYWHAEALVVVSVVIKVYFIILAMNPEAMLFVEKVVAVAVAAPAAPPSGGGGASTM